MHSNQTVSPIRSYGRHAPEPRFRKETARLRRGAERSSAIDAELALAADD